MTTSAVLPGTIYTTLRGRILDRREVPGATLTESAVAAQFGVARSTAKLALERLVVEGLLVRAPYHAARVPELRRADILDLFETRSLIESAAMAALARGGELPALALAAHRRLIDRVSVDRDLASYDADFHRQLVSGQRSPRLARMHSVLMGEIELCIAQVQAHNLVAPAHVAAQHQAILDAITAGDAELAAQRARTHVEGTRDALLAHFEDPPDTEELR